MFSLLFYTWLRSNRMHLHGIEYAHLSLKISNFNSDFFFNWYVGLRVDYSVLHLRSCLLHYTPIQSSILIEMLFDYLTTLFIIFDIKRKEEETSGVASFQLYCIPHCCFIYKGRNPSIRIDVTHIITTIFYGCDNKCTAFDTRLYGFHFLFYALWKESMITKVIAAYISYT